MVDQTPTSPCPDFDMLERHAARALDEEAERAVSEHVRTCQSCSQALEPLLAEEALATRLRDATGTQREASLRRGLQQSLGNGYEVLDALGEGASGLVFKARDSRLNRLVAIKALGESSQGEPLADALQEGNTWPGSTIPAWRRCMPCPSHPTRRSSSWSSWTACPLRRH